MTARVLAASGALALFVAGVSAVLVLAIAAERDAARLARASRAARPRRLQRRPSSRSS